MRARKIHKWARRRLEAPKGLSIIIDQRTRRRRHRYLRDIRNFLAPVLLCVLMQSALYFLVATRFGRSDWANIFIAIAVLATVPVLTAFVLTAFRRHAAPVMVAIIIASAMFSFAVSTLSAVRLPISYQALLACWPVITAVMAYANVSFHQSRSEKTVLAPFNGAEQIAEDLDVPLLDRGSAQVRADVDTLLIDPLEHHKEEWAPLLAQYYLSDVEVVPWTQYLEHRFGRLDIDSFESTYLAYLPSQVLYARLKRIMDVAAVIITLPLTLPLALFTGLYIAWRDGFPVIFVQLRRGYAGRPFRMYKFRTMYKGSAGGATSAQDSRIIRGCGVLRKFRLDEIPQLFNVLLGEMSVIGPRPEAIDLAKSYERVMPKYLLRLMVLPGLTGWAQVNSGYSGNLKEAREKLSYDLYYIKHMSLDLDLRIALTTIRTLLLRRGAR
ncbi:MAG TPA: sugar transferase [Pseudorhizobium sp.]|nr:sugar transferase [Pseudorhizobium sp.]